MTENKKYFTKQLDKYKEFRKFYLEIVKDLNLNEKKDIEARDLLSRFIEEKKSLMNYDLEKILRLFKQEIQSKSIVIIYGCGPSLEESVNYLIKEIDQSNSNHIINLAADGASVLLRELKVPLDALFSDLDGVTEKEINLSHFVIVLSHGDNIKKLKEFHDELIRSTNLICTTQVEPTDYILNSGGFTDGDRILYFIKPFLSVKHSIFLIGMDFQDVVGKYSKPFITENQKASEFKQKKLNYGLKLIEHISMSMNNDIFFVNSRPSSTKFKYLTLEEAKRKLLILKGI